MDTELTKILEESILAVYNEKGEDIPFKSAKIKHNIENKRGVQNRYPSLYLDNILCCARNKKIKYVCPNCKTENTILLKRFLTKESKECK